MKGSTCRRFVVYSSTYDEEMEMNFRFDVYKMQIEHSEEKTCCCCF